MRSQPATHWPTRNRQGFCPRRLFRHSRDLERCGERGGWFSDRPAQSRHFTAAASDPLGQDRNEFKIGERTNRGEIVLINRNKGEAVAQEGAFRGRTSESKPAFQLRCALIPSHGRPECQEMLHSILLHCPNFKLCLRDKYS
jgi:hypothetical protein